MKRHMLTGIAVAIALTGCASKMPTVTDQELATATQTGNLETVYNNFATQLASQKLSGTEGQQAKARLDQIGSQLATKREQDIRQDLGQYMTASGLAPLPVVDAAIAKLPPIQKWDNAKYQALSQEFGSLKSKTQARISAQQDTMGKLTETDLTQRMAILDELALLTGDQRYTKERVDLLATLRQKADDALKNEQYGDAKQALATLQKVNPNDQTISSQLLQADAKLFEKKFWDALANGKLDDAYTQFMSLAQTPEFPEVLKRLNKSTDDMVAYFLAQAGNATTEGRLDDAYKLLTQARDIRQKTNPGAAAAPIPVQENAFLTAVFAKYQAAAKAGQPGLAWGYLKVIDSFNPDYQGLRALLRTTQDQVQARATKKVSTAAFTDPNGNTEMGGAVAARVTQRLFEKIPHDIKIIERDQFAAILREKELSNAPKNNDDLVSADYLVQGKITESRVDTTQDRSKKTMRVVTDNVTITNPDYAAWLALPEGQRKGLAEPARTVSQEKKEDVTINLQVMRKVGIIAATYRLIEAKTGRVIATDSDTAKAEFTDEGNEGVELGQFHLPFKLATLPSDTEILQKLTEKISSTIGDKLVEQLANPQVRYVQAAQRFADESDYGSAAEQAAYALVMAQQDNQETKTLRQSLEQYSVQAAR